MFFINTVSLSTINDSWAHQRICEKTQFPGCTVNGDPKRDYLNSGEKGYVICSGVEYECTGCGSCTPVSSSSSPTRGLHPSQQIAMGIVGAMINEVFSGMFDDLFAPPERPSQDALKKQQEERQALERWMDLQTEAELKRLNDEAEKRKKGEEILAKTSIGGGGLKIESIGGGQLTPFNWDAPRLPATPAPSGQYNTSRFTMMERLLCAAYFSKIAEGAANSGYIEGSRFYGTQMDNVMQGYPTAIECKPPKDLSSTAMDIKKAGELNQKYTKMATLYKEMMPKIEKLQDLETKLDEVKNKKEEAEQKIKEIDQKIEEIKTKCQTADTPEKKKQEDDLLTQALALRSEAEKQKQEAVESEEKLTKEKQGIKEELNAIKDKMQTRGER